MTDVLARAAISVIVCAYTEERWEEIVAAIASIEVQSYRAVEVVLVVDHNLALHRRATLAFPEVKVVENTGSRGLSGARNSGIAACSGDVVAFLDDDAAAAPDWLSELASVFEAPDVIGAGGLVVPAWEVERPSWFPSEFDWVIGCSHSGMPKSTQVVRNFVGANMAFRRLPLGELGGFSAVLGRTGADAAGCEETELCIRAASFDGGARLIYEPRALVRHHVPNSRGTWRYFLRRCYAEGRSKASVTTLAGTEEGLAAEREYVRRTIPCGVGRALVDSVSRHPKYALRAVALVSGTLVTLLGYLGARGTARVAAHLDLLRLSAQPRLGAIVRSLLSWFAIPIAAFALWIASLLTSGIPGQMSDAGLLSILPPTYYLGLALVILGFGLELRRGAPRTGVLVVHLVLLLAILHLTPQLLYGTLRYTWAWKHVAITNFVVQTHGVQLNQPIPSLVAYQDWPGFFTLNALLTAGSGFASAVSYAPWWPFLNELSYAAPLLLIYRTFPIDRRTQWGALLLFYLGNWIGQDYYSPQGFAFFLYLTLLALVLRHFRTEAAQVHPDPLLVATAGTPVGRRNEHFVFALCALLMFAIASSHQLTPFMVLSALVFLVVFRTARRRSFPIVAAAIALGWMALAAQTFVADNGPSLLQGFGALLSNADVNQLNSAQASADQLLVSKLDRLLTAGIIVLAVFGFIRGRIGLRDRRWLPAVLLTLSPCFALAANSYGGEIVFRVYLFGLPFLALFGAKALGVSRLHAARWADGAVRVAVVGGLATTFLFSYYGKERSNYYSPNEVASIDRFYHLVPAGSYITGIAGNDPWPESGYQSYQYYWYTQVSPEASRALVAHPVTTLLHDMSSSTHAYVLFTTSDAAQVEMTGQLPRGAFGRIEQAVLTSGRFRVVEQTPTVLALEPSSALSAVHVGASRSSVRSQVASLRPKGVVQ